MGNLKKGYAVFVMPDWSLHGATYARKIKDSLFSSSIIADGLCHIAAKAKIAELKQVYPQGRIHVRYVDEYGEYSPIDCSSMVSRRF